MTWVFFQKLYWKYDEDDAVGLIGEYIYVYVYVNTLKIGEYRKYGNLM